MLLMISGCSVRSHYFVLSNPSPTPKVEKLKAIRIGVEKVEIPAYLMKREIAVFGSSSEVDYLHGSVWAEDLDAGITRRLIAYLQKRFDQPHIYAYPWEMEREPEIKVKVNLSKFIVQQSRVCLDASWEIRDHTSGKSLARLFHKEVPVERTSAEGIVTAMDRALGYLEEDIAKGMLRF